MEVFLNKSIKFKEKNIIGRTRIKKFSLFTKLMWIDLNGYGILMTNDNTFLVGFHFKTYEHVNNKNF